MWSASHQVDKSLGLEQWTLQLSPDDTSTDAIGLINHLVGTVNARGNPDPGVKGVVMVVGGLEGHGGSQSIVVHVATDLAQNVDRGLVRGSQDEFGFDHDGRRADLTTRHKSAGNDSTPANPGAPLPVGGVGPHLGLEGSGGRRERWAQLRKQLEIEFDARRWKALHGQVVHPTGTSVVDGTLCDSGRVRLLVSTAGAEMVALATGVFGALGAACVKEAH